MAGLLDFLQSASNSAASNVSAPVDALAWLLRKAGIPVPEDAMGGSAWMERQGLTRPVQQSGASLAGETLGLLAPIAAAAKSKQVAGLLANLQNKGAAGKMESSAARSSPNIFDPKPVAQRPFHADYPQGTAGPDGSRLALDIDGRALSPGSIVAGRRMAGGVDEGLSPGDLDRIADLLGIRRGFAAKTGPELKGDAGRYYGGPDRRIFVDQALTPEKGARVFGHELGHGIDDLAMAAVGPKGSRIPTDGLSKELRQVFSDLNTAGYVPKGKIGAKPETGYAANQVDAELMAEAIRAYGRDPNYLKSVAPKTAARIREYVNANPNLSKVIQFNSAAGAGLLGGGLLGFDEGGS